MKTFNLTIALIFFSILTLSAQETRPDREKLTIEETQNPLLGDKFWIEAGVFFPNKSLTIGADGSIGEKIEFDERFNLNKTQLTYFLNFEWRWNKKWRLTAESFSVYNSSTVTLDSTIVFDKTTFEKGTSVKAGIDFSLFRVFVGRTISSGQKHSLGAGLGVHAMNLGAFIEGNIKSDNEELNGKFQKKSVEVFIPLPNIGAWYHWAPTEKWAFIARVDWFYIGINQLTAGMWDIAPSVRYQFVKNFGVGVGYRAFLLNADINTDNWNGSGNMDFTGPSITINGNF